MKRFRSIRDHALSGFFVRLFLLLLVLAALGAGGIYYYFERESALRVGELVDSSSKEIEQEMLSLDPADTKAHQKLREAIQKRLQESPLLKAEVTNPQGEVLLHYEKESLPLPVEQLFKGFESGYTMLPIHEDAFVLFYAKKLNIGGDILNLRLILPIEQDTVSVLFERVKTVWWTLAVTLFLVVIVIFPIVFRQYRQLHRDKLELLISNLGTINALGNAIAKRDSDTHTHNYRVTYYAIRLAEALKISKQLFPALIKGAFLHDVGKIGIPDSILLKPGLLDDEEFAQMKRHVELGVEIVQGVEWLQDATEVIRFHHERYDGSGYPHGRKSEEIPLVARIFSVADVFDALTSKRPYKEPFSMKKSLEMISRQAGIHFDPAVAIVFLDIAETLHDSVKGKQEEEVKTLLFEAMRPYVPVLMEKSTVNPGELENLRKLL